MKHGQLKRKLHYDKQKKRENGGGVCRNKKKCDKKNFYF